LRDFNNLPQSRLSFCFWLVGKLAAAFAYSLVRDFPIMQRWIERPYLLLFPAVAAAATLALISAIRRRRTRCRSGWRPDLSVSIRDACRIVLALHDSIPDHYRPGGRICLKLNFMYWGAGLLILPLTLAYTAMVYRVFGGKLIESADDC
jgi:cytochrome d ubiquinol oxidase subunit II